jgi:hypothetical protein
MYEQSAMISGCRMLFLRTRDGLLTRTGGQNVYQCRGNPKGVRAAGIEWPENHSSHDALQGINLPSEQIPLIRIFIFNAGAKFRMYEEKSTRELENGGCVTYEYHAV